MSSSLLQRDRSEEKGPGAGTTQEGEDLRSISDRNLIAQSGSQIYRWENRGR